MDGEGATFTFKIEEAAPAERHFTTRVKPTKLDHQALATRGVSTSPERLPIHNQSPSMRKSQQIEVRRLQAKALSNHDVLSHKSLRGGAHSQQNSSSLSKLSKRQHDRRSNLSNTFARKFKHTTAQERELIKKDAEEKLAAAAEAQHRQLEDISATVSVGVIQAVASMPKLPAPAHAAGRLQSVKEVTERRTREQRQKIKLN